MNNNATCILDRDIVNSDTIGEMDDLGLAVFAKLCGANRGAFGEMICVVSFVCVCCLLFESAFMNTE